MVRYKNLIAVIILALLLVTSAAYWSGRVRAFAPDVVSIFSSKWSWERIKDVFNSARESVSSDLWSRALDMYMQNLAYSVANELATGAAGGKPLFRTKSIKDYSQQALEAAGGEFISELTKVGFDDLGLNLCDPAVQIKQTLVLSLIDEQAPPKPSCNWTNIKKNWEQFGESFANDLVKFQLDPRGGAKNIQDFWKGILKESHVVTALQLFSELSKRQTEEEKAQARAVAECQGFLDKVTTITEEVKIHCTQIKGFSDEQYKAALEADLKKKAEAASQKTSNVKIFAKIMKDAANRFINTFSSKLLKQWIKKGTWSLFGAKDEGSKNLRDDLLARLRGGADVRQPRNQDIFRDLKTTTLEKVEDYSLLNDFVICPEEKEFRQPDNCVIDTPFLQAITAGQTVKEAMKDGLIDPNTILVGKDDVLRNNSDDCYRQGLCYSNLVKLRKANIIPVGWEMAALRSSVTAPVTLKQATNCFEDIDCPFGTDPEYAVAGQPHNPFYHLVDGDWVLKTSKAECEALVYASVLESPEAPNRQQYCADFKTCLREDGEGNCIGEQFSYCSKSENIWRFQGDICEDGEIYAGCLNFSNEEFGDASYIEGSLDYEDCSADQAGCRRYTQERRADGSWILENIIIDDNDLFLTHQAKDCPESEAGCQEYIVMAADAGVNVIRNASFDNVDNDISVPFPDGRPDGWHNAAGVDTDAVEYITATGRIANGNAFTLAPAGSELLNQEIVLLPNTSYALSVAASQYVVGNSDQANVRIEACDFSEPCDVATVADAGPLEELGTCYQWFDPDLADMVQMSWTPGNGLGRMSCTFKTRDIAIGSGRIILSSNDGVVWFDEVKLEVISDLTAGATTFSNYGEGGLVNMGGDRVMCSAREVGCQGYNPANGDPMIPAVINQDDLCPAECVGYATFTEQPTVFDLIEDPLAPVEYYNFITDTATSCPQSAVGCEEFTNLDEVAQGGEGREYYTYVRQCVLEFEGEPFYTWEGSDTEGYQIRTWLALENTVLGGPCTNVQRGSGVCLDENPFPTAICGPLTPLDFSDDPNVEPDCREFFDNSGVSHWRLQDRVIFASNDCHDYRRTISGEIYRIIPNISTACSAQENNCRSYYGNVANNVREVFSDNFENGTYQPWLAGAGVLVDLSTESLQNNGHSVGIHAGSLNAAYRPLVAMQNQRQYQLSFWLKSDGFLDELRPVLQLYDNNNAPQGTVLNRDANDDVIESNFFAIEAGNWNHYTVTKYVDLQDPAWQIPDNANGRLILLFDAVIDTQVYIDNIILREVTDSVAVIKNSWQTPAICDDPYSGYHLGCQAYVDTNGQTFNLKSFNRLCREEAIGCMAVIDTHNSDNPAAQTFHDDVPDPSLITVPEDSLDYLVPDPGKYCQSIYQGCSVLGQPDRDDETVFTTVYKINDPDQYESSLCYSFSLWCEAFDSSKGLYYFKYPGQNTCTYQTNVNINDILYNGWLRTDSLDQPLLVGCSDGLDGDPNPGIFEPRDLALASAMPATCPPDKNLCTVFRDPVDPVDCDIEAAADYCLDDPNIGNERDCEDPALGASTWIRSCQAYYYYDNQNIDESSCLGQVDRGQACILFYEGNNWDANHREVITKYDAVATYDINVSENRPTSPITCDNSDPDCNANRLIKVRNDRQCSEWLACKSSTAVWDERSNGYITVCDDLDSCIKYDSSNNITNCKQWATPEPNPQPLTIEQYQSRTSGPNNHLAWSDEEYIGYSVPELLPLRSLLTYDFSGTDEDITDSRLVYSVAFGPCLGNDGVTCSTLVDGTACNPGDLGCFFGECREDKCWVSPLAGDTAISTFSTLARGYAESDAPFPSAIDDLGLGDRISAYEKANICERIVNCQDASFTTEADCVANGFIWTRNKANCEEEFNKITYGTSGGVKYYPKNVAGDLGVCIAGDQTKVKDKAACEINQFCDSPPRSDPNPNDASNLIAVSDGICALQTKVETFLNWQGICLEKDGSTPLVTDSGQDHYCNQWYPVTTINGVSSLFDNYRQAGYYNPTGQDVSFCAVTGPYQLDSDRYYCEQANSEGCTVLLKVLQGAKIKIDAIEANAALLNQHYLKPNVFQEVLGAALDPVIWDRVETMDPNDRSLNADDFRSDPNITLQQVPVYAMNDLLAFFDGTIEKYYLDISLVTWMGEPPGSYHHDSRCEDILAYMEANNWCTPDEHLTYAYWQRHEGCYKRGWAYCNPLTYHYYVKVAAPASVDCRDTNCSAPAKGLACIGPLPTFSDLYSNPQWSAGDPLGYCQNDPSVRCSAPTCPGPTNCYKYPWVEGILSTPAGDYSVCRGDVNCEFVKCTAEVAFANPQHVGDLDPLTRLPLVPAPTWCSDYGQVVTDNVRYCDPTLIYLGPCFSPGAALPSTNATIATVSAINGCYTKIYERVAMSQSEIEAAGVPPNEAARIQDRMFKAQVKPDVNASLYREAFGDDTAPGCFVSDVSADCRVISGWATQIGAPCCVGANCDNCYQMCSTIAELDADGDNSWVRTDIWWRSQESRERINSSSWVDFGPWLSYYYKNGAFIQDDQVVFDRIKNYPRPPDDPLPDDYFGAAVGAVGSSPVLVEAPVGVPIGNALSAATFFSPEDSIDHTNLAYLLARVYNRVWDPALGRYEPGQPVDIDNLLAEDVPPDPREVTNVNDLVNPVAGVGYPPQILKVCGNSETCPDAAGQAQAGLTVNNQQSARIEGHGSLFVAIKFFYYAHPDHMPIRSVDVNWGDSGVYTSNTGKYKNSLPRCDVDLPMPGLDGLQGFGGREQACRQGYKISYNDYQYDPSYACGLVPGAPPEPNASCYKPKVKVVDWWNQQTIEEYEDWVVIYRD